jgi:hypothetical protein
VGSTGATCGPAQLPAPVRVRHGSTPPHVADHRLRSCRLRTGHGTPAAEPGAEAEDEPGAAHSSESDSHDDGDGASPVPVA